MAKQPKDSVLKKKFTLTCDCGSEMKWIKFANNNRYYWYCEKCQQMLDRHGKVYVYGKR